MTDIPYVILFLKLKWYRKKIKSIEQNKSKILKLFVKLKQNENLIKTKINLFLKQKYRWLLN